MKNIKKVIQVLNNQQKLHQSEVFNYVVPSLFNFFNYQKGISDDNNQLKVNPYNFYYEALCSLIKNKPNKNYLASISTIHKIKSSNGAWIREAFVYSSMIRTSSSYDHNQDGIIELSNQENFKESGTFLKQMLLIPYLKELGIDTIYLLPFFQNSNAFKKGEFGSCYAIKDPFQLDETLSDPILDSLTLDEQAKAFFEICHMHDMRVIIDIIPRTSAIDSVWIKEHPDWFYWIHEEARNTYKPPYYEELKDLLPPTPKNMNIVYHNPKTKEFLKQFSLDPQTLDSQKYKDLIERCERDNLNVLEEIRKDYHLVVACAFSDWINDPQPVWSDVTYLRMFLDNNDTALCHIDPEHPPYILFDSTKANLYPCQRINIELWNLLIEIIPFYQKEFGIDGVRIDMGHALPTLLVDKIIKKAKIVDPDICIIAEELDTGNARKSATKGYNMILGNGFSEESRINEGKLHKFYYGAKKLACPVFALCESHDTSRVSAKPGKKKLNIMLTTLNLFMPNGVAFLNSGQELFEVQPMNLGLDCPESERYNLSKDDPRYNKLALFDPFYFTYNNYDPTLVNLLIELKDIRKEYLKSIIHKSKNIPATFDKNDHLALGSFFIKKDKALLVVANTDLEKNQEYEAILDELQAKVNFEISSIKELYSTANNQIPIMLHQNKIYLPMKSLEVKLIVIQ